MAGFLPDANGLHTGRSCDVRGGPHDVVRGPLARGWDCVQENAVKTYDKSATWQFLS